MAELTNTAVTAKIHSEPEGQESIDYVVTNHYEQDRHTYVAGISSPGGFQGASVAFFQLAAPTLLWFADWTASAFGYQPFVPDPFSVSSDWVLLDVHLETANILLAADLVTALYRISGTYVYGHKNPDNNTFSNIAFGRPPWFDDSFNRSMPLSQLKQSIIDWQSGGGTLTPLIGTGGGTSGGATPLPPFVGVVGG